jgi:hypothetical protein
MAGHGQKLTRKQEALISALLSHPTVVMAAKSVGISEATAGRWKKDSAFQDAYHQARHAALDRALAALEQDMLGAVAVLRSVMLGVTVPAATRVRAALGLLEMSMQASIAADQERRLRALEDRQGM